MRKRWSHTENTRHCIQQSHTLVHNSQSLNDAHTVTTSNLTFDPCSQKWPSQISPHNFFFQSHIWSKLTKLTLTNFQLTKFFGGLTNEKRSCVRMCVTLVCDKRFPRGGILVDSWTPDYPWLYPFLWMWGRGFEESVRDREVSPFICNQVPENRIVHTTER